MSRKRTKHNLLENLQRYFGRLLGSRRVQHLEWQAGPWAVQWHGIEEVPDHQVVAEIMTVPCHYGNPNTTQYDESAASWASPDPFPGQTSTTFGASALSHTYEGHQSLQSIAASGTESRTLNDPTRLYQTIGLTLTKKSTVNLQVMGNIPWWLQATLNNFTTNGNFGVFSAVDQTLQIFSVAISKAVGATYTAVHNSPVTVGANGAGRWCAVFSDGATVN